MKLETLAERLRVFGVIIVLSRHFLTFGRVAERLIDDSVFDQLANVPDALELGPFEFLEGEAHFLVGLVQFAARPSLRPIGV